MKPRLTAALVATLLVGGLLALGAVCLAIGWALAAWLSTSARAEAALLVGLAGLAVGLGWLWRYSYQECLHRIRMGKGA